MGSHLSSEIKYVYTSINGQSVLVPYIRYPNGQWVPIQQAYHEPYNGNYVVLNTPYYRIAPRHSYLLQHPAPGGIPYYH
ncbi:hypothetical protein G6F70_004840 [Rhizopus microsporus]|uniref:Uncharacterized protein n=1 Tax=Rhizopus azygosporus TaxID=86630 RepID=A0A367K8L1_RHIAZ|nr:hypothetical protein G6F71_004973 [Rhizopus microsporus]RCH98507.1 hypothetical protein CU097_014537 [Rhizopus azygosporus]KAG1199532.1 hypothetical protein G6F70_004840 [Rhizopus microsporus]KAG1211260.1 hypothetical protein G6F69_004748 [Rhizopus microsporus]KAG1233026.1 hypothetical protein G6F67_004573 [Rhizopus microsporus]